MTESENNVGYMQFEPVNITSSLFLTDYDLNYNNPLLSVTYDCRYLQ